MSDKVLFTVSIGNNEGKIEVTSPAKRVYLLSFTYAPDNRLTAPFCKAFLLALNILEMRYPAGVLIHTSSIQKFYSNGYNLQHITETPGFWEEYWFPLLRRLLVFPWPTVSLINGHAFGAGVFLALASDYRIMNPSKGFLCLPEIAMGAIIPTPVQTMFKQKLPSPAVFRTLVLEGIRVSGPKALEMGVVDGLGGFDEAMKLVESRQLVGKADGGVWGALKEDMYSETLASIDGYQEGVRWRKGIERGKEEMKEKAEKDVKEWEDGSGKAKL